MSDINASASADTAKSSQIAAGLLSQLGAALGGDTPRDQLFANLLAQDQADIQTQAAALRAQQNAANKADASGASANKGQDANADGTAAASADAARPTDIWRNSPDKVRAQSGSAQDKPSSMTAVVNTKAAGSKTAAKSATAPSSSSSSAPSSPSVNAPSGMVKPAAASNSASSNTASASGTGEAATQTANDPNAPSPADILAQLQALAQYLQKQLQAAQNSGGAAQSADATTGAKAMTVQSGDANSLSISDILSRFLALSQQLEKGLQAAQATAAPSGGAAATGTQTASSSPAAPNLAALESQLKTDLQSLLSALQGGNSADAQTSDSATAAGAASSSGSASANASTAVSSPAPQAQTVATSLLAVSNDFIDLFKNGFGAAAANASAGNSVFAALSDKQTAAPIGDGKDGALLDQDGGADKAASTGKTAADAALLANGADAAKSANPYSFASQLSATRATSGMTGLPSAVEQVILQMNRNVKSGDNQMSIQLHPADLGKIDIKLAISSDGKVQGTVVASNPATLDLLHKDVRSLERALQEAGLSADPGSLQFSMSGQPGQSGNGAGNSAGNADGTSSNPVSGGDAASVLAPVSTDPSDVWVITPGRVNLKV